jgi:hypothetical protein
LPSPLLYPLPDGSITLAEPDSGQLYHNQSGAWVESQSLYLAHTQAHLPGLAMAGLGGAEAGRLRVLEGCFGLGYNTWSLLLSWWAGDLPGVHSLDVVGCDTDLTLSHLWDGCVASAPHPEAHALAWAVAHAMAGGTRLGNGIELTLAHPQHDGVATLQVSGCDLLTLLTTLRPGRLHVAFHDPFSREVHPALWSEGVFQAYARLLQPGGVVITYSCAGAVRRAMVAAGFQVSRTGPVGGKRSGGLVAKKP